MKIDNTSIDGLVVLTPDVYTDERGYFMETYNQEKFHEFGILDEFPQDNESMSCKGTLRGMHFQTNNSQAKLVRVTQGEVYDVVVDLRTESKTYLKWFGIYLNDRNKKMLYVPERFAHGFLVISNVAKFNYKCSNLYDSNSDSGIMYNDENINIKWPKMDYIISDKDLCHNVDIKNIKWRKL